MSEKANYQEVFRRFGGPMSYSQYVNPATVGAAMASLDIHKTSELAVLQEKLSSNIRLFDSMFVTEHAGSGLPIRVIPLDSPDMAIGVSEGVFKRGYYTSAVFFPIVARNKSGLRVMMRADMSQSDVLGFCSAVKAEIERARLSLKPARY
jgi:7-keto-8-aminopelargonate synthetase-like enzyme